MRSIRRFILSLAAILLFSGVAMTLPAVADHGSGDNTVSSSSDDSNTADSTTTTDNSTTSTEPQSNDLTEQFREMAKEKLDAARADHQEQSEQHRQRACEARKANLTRREANAVRFATTHKAVFDKIYQRVQDFYTNKQLNVSNYDTLKAAVDSASTDAQTSIGALQTLNTSSIDCTSQTVADSISAFQASVKDTRDKLKAYRSALVDLIKAIKGASTGTDATSSGNDTTNTGNQ